MNDPAVKGDVHEGSVLSPLLLFAIVIYVVMESVKED